jgi:hypothetical protein
MRNSLKVAMLFVGVCLCGCATKRKLIPTPVMYTDDAIDPFDHVPAACRTTEVSVFYATNRNRKGSTEDARYGTGFDNKLHVGISQIHFGTSDTTWDQLHEASVVEDRKEHIYVSRRRSKEFGVLSFSMRDGTESSPDTPVGDRAFLAAINEQLAQSQRWLGLALSLAPDPARPR